MESKTGCQGNDYQHKPASLIWECATCGGKI